MSVWAARAASKAGPQGRLPSKKCNFSSSFWFGKAASQEKIINQLEAMGGLAFPSLLPADVSSFIPLPPVPHLWGFINIAKREGGQVFLPLSFLFSSSMICSSSSTSFFTISRVPRRTLANSMEENYFRQTLEKVGQASFLSGNSLP